MNKSFVLLLMSKHQKHVAHSSCAEGRRHRGGGAGIEKGGYVTTSPFPAGYKEILSFQPLTRHRTQFLLVNKMLLKISVPQGKAK